MSSIYPVNILNGKQKRSEGGGRKQDSVYDLMSAIRAKSHRSGMVSQVLAQKCEASASAVSF